VVYGALLGLGPATGYQVARAARLARANAYAALEGLVARGAAARSAGRPTRYRPADPHALVAQVAARQGEALDQLTRALESAGRRPEPETHVVEGFRAVANVIQQFVARAGREVRGVLAAELWAPTLPAWRRAAGRARLDLRLTGEVADTQGLAVGTAPADTPTLLLLDDTYAVTATGAGDHVQGLWSSHPLIVGLARRALGNGE
jgi:HTH-type transcriptional regulator, sugar sensing transcriptional regulator